jgi:hypothetical protein
MEEDPLWGWVFAMMAAAFIINMRATLARIRNVACAGQEIALV